MFTPFQAILPKSNVPADQQQANKAATNVDYLSNLDILSRADHIRLSGIVCTIGTKILETKHFAILLNIFLIVLNFF